MWLQVRLSSTRRRGGRPFYASTALTTLPWSSSQPEIPAGVSEGEALVIEAQQVEDGGLQIVDVDVIDLRLETKLVGRTIDGAALHAAAGDGDTAHHDRPSPANAGRSSSLAQANQ